MNNGVYGSPFPKLNPNMRYKTVFERAGFEIYTGDLPQPHPHSNNHHHHHHRHNNNDNNNGVQSPVTKPRSSSSSSAMPLSNHGDSMTSADGGISSISKMRGTRERVMSSPIKNTEYISQAHSDREQGVQRHNYPYKTSTHPTSSDSTIYLTRRTSGAQCYENGLKMGTLDSSSNDGYGDSSLPKEDRESQHQQGLSDLTRVDNNEKRQSSNSSSSSSRSSRNSEFSNNSAVHRHRFVSCNNDKSNRDDIPFSQSPSPSCSSTRSEFSYTPSQNRSSSRTSSTETSNSNNSNNNNTDNQHQKGLANVVARDLVTSHTLSLEDTQTRSSTPLSPITPTGASVEQLLAQLDKVSFSRNEKISETLQGASASASTANRSLSKEESPEDLHTISTTQPSKSSLSPPPPSSGLSSTAKKPESTATATDNGNVKEISYKKSSAYLSGFPQLPNYNDDDNDNAKNPLALQPQISEQSQLVPETPVFYSFPRETGPSLGITHDNSNGEPVKQGLKETPETTNQNTASSAPKFKYPPGEGPCRLCGKKIVGKGIFSKKQNELSGQWHRHCFKCCKCDTVFNKHIPCYILDDNPYCQQHYHETNHSICGVCKKWIEGGCLENDNGERFHIDCLKCFVCGDKIYGDYFIFNDTVPLCSKHDIEALVDSGVIGQELGGESALSKRRTKLIELA